MSIDLDTVRESGDKVMSAADVYILSAGSRTQLRDNETGEVIDRMDETVPDGKVWTVNVSIQIIEANA